MTYENHSNSNIHLYQPGIAYKRFKLRTQIATTEYKHNSLHFSNQYKSYESFAQFKQSLTYNDRGFVFDFYFYPVRVKQVSECIWQLTVGKLQHYSTLYNEGHRNLFGKWVSGWKTNMFGISHNYRLEDVALEGIKEELDKFIARLRKQYSSMNKQLVVKCNKQA